MKRWMRAWELDYVTFEPQKKDSSAVFPQFYKDDSFGLRTLDQQGKVKVYEVPGIEHLEWPLSSEVFEKYIEPWLH